MNTGSEIGTIGGNVDFKAAYWTIYLPKDSESRIGTIGTADGAYLAHLHFEAIRSLSNEAGMPAYHPAGTMNRINPAELIANHPAPAISDPYEQVRRLMIRETANAAPATTSQISPSQSSSDTIQINPAQFLK